MLNYYNYMRFFLIHLLSRDFFTEKEVEKNDRSLRKFENRLILDHLLVNNKFQ